MTSFAADGCNTRPPLPALQPTPTPNPPAAAVLKIAPAETTFDVELETEFNSASNRAGDPFRVRLLTSIDADDGDTIVPPDAEIAGRVVDIRSSPAPAVLVRFDSIDTRWGPSAIRASFTSTQPDASVVGDRSRFAGYDGAILPAPGIPLLTDTAPGTAQAIRLPPGSRLRLVLTDVLAVRALVPPDVGVTPAQ
jgi:hypothetical protein